MRLYYYYFSLNKKKSFNDPSLKKFQKLEDIDLSKYKTSSKLFIIGSGASINDITKKQWEEINNHDTFGFNFSFINQDHVPTFYSFEAVEEINLNENKMLQVAEIFCSEYKKVKERYKNVPKILSDLNLARVDYFLKYGRDLIDENLYLVNTVNGIAKSEAEFEELIKYYKSKGIFDKKNNINKVFKFRATLSMAISLGINLGYEEIILCGIDLNDPRYFYQDRKLYPDTPEFRSSPDTKVHTTMLQSKVMIPITAVVKVLNKKIMKDKGINLSIMNSKSELAKILSTWN